MKNSEIGSAEVSRRTMLHGVACAAAGAAVAVAADRALAQSKASQTSVAYQDNPKGSQSCANCLLFQGPNACKSVAGTIAPSGWCKIWVPK